MKTFIYPTVRVVEFHDEEILTESLGVGGGSFNDENAVEIQGGYYFDEEEY